MKIKRKASVSIEAAISLIATMSVMITLNTFVRVTYVHGVVQHALTQVANEMATYDYVLSLLGISALDQAAMAKTMGSARQATDTTNAAADKVEEGKTVAKDTIKLKDDTVLSVQDMKNKFGEFSGVLNDLSGGDTSSLSEFSPSDVSGTMISDKEKLQGDMNAVSNDFQAFSDFSELKTAMSDSDGNINIMQVLKSYVAGTMGEGLSMGKTAAMGAVTKAMLSTYIDDEMMNKNIVYAKKPNGNDSNDAFIAGLDLSSSKFFDYPNVDTMEICCSYMVKVPSPIPIIEYVPLVNTVKVRAWQEDWDAVMMTEHTSVWIDCPSTVKVHDAILVHEAPEMAQPRGTFAYYDKASKTAFKNTSINLITRTTSGKSDLQGDLSRIINYNPNSRNDKTIKTDEGEISVAIDDIKTVKYTVYIPSPSAVMATEDGKKLIQKQNELANNGSSEELTKEIAELEKSIKQKKAKLAEDSKQLRADVEELKARYNAKDSGSPFDKIEIIVKSVDYPYP